MRITTTLLFLLLALAGCADTAREPVPVEAQIGQNCIVYFRRDALGMGADSPSSIVAGNINGADVTQSGELMAVGDDWIVINLHGREFHIPQAAILMVEFGNNISGKPGLSEPLQHAPDNHGGHMTH
jgi:hypothetical protein